MSIFHYTGTETISLSTTLQERPGRFRDVIQDLLDQGLAGRELFDHIISEGYSHLLKLTIRIIAAYGATRQLAPEDVLHGVVETLLRRFFPQSEGSSSEQSGSSSGLLRKFDPDRGATPAKYLAGLFQRELERKAKRSLSRKGTRMFDNEWSELVPDPNGDRKIEQVTSKADLLMTINRLPVHLRKVVVAYYLHNGGQTITQVSEQLSTPRSTINDWLLEARDRLKLLMQDSV